MGSLTQLVLVLFVFFSLSVPLYKGIYRSDEGIMFSAILMKKVEVMEVE